MMTDNDDSCNPFPFPDEALFDPATLFPDHRLPAVGTIMDLTGLQAVLRPQNHAKTWFEELFLPDRIYVRAEMHQSFHELVSDEMYMKVLSGSPGIGKSILLFLVAIFRAWTEENLKISYLRHTQSVNEDASVFAMMMIMSTTNTSSSPNMLQIRFNRFIDPTQYSALQAFARAGDSFRPQYPRHHPNVRTFVDGPPITDESYRLTHYRYFCTSGSGMRIKNVNHGKIQNYVFGRLAT